MMEETQTQAYSVCVAVKDEQNFLPLNFYQDKTKQEEKTVYSRGFFARRQTDETKFLRWRV